MDPAPDSSKLYALQPIVCYRSIDNVDTLCTCMCHARTTDHHHYHQALLYIASQAGQAQDKCTYTRINEFKIARQHACLRCVSMCSARARATHLIETIPPAYTYSPTHICCVDTQASNLCNILVSKHEVLVLRNWEACVIDTLFQVQICTGIKWITVIIITRSIQLGASPPFTFQRFTP